MVLNFGQDNIERASAVCNKLKFIFQPQEKDFKCLNEWIMNWVCNIKKYNTDDSYCLELYSIHFHFIITKKKDSNVF